MSPPSDRSRFGLELGGHGTVLIDILLGHGGHLSCRLWILCIFLCGDIISVFGVCLLFDFKEQIYKLLDIKKLTVTDVVQNTNLNECVYPYRNENLARIEGTKQRQKRRLPFSFVVISTNE